MAEPTTLIEQAEKIQDRFQRALDEARADRNLSDEGKRKLIRDQYLSAKSQMERLKSAHTQGTKDRVDSLQRRLFGTVGTTPQDVIAHRDAVDRATALDEEGEAITMMRNAITFRDVTLQRAILRRAFEAGTVNEWNGKWSAWLDLINVYAAEYPASEADLQELYNAYAAAATSRGSTLEMVQTATTWIIKPVELSGDYTI